MTRKAKDLLSEALQLPGDERAELAAELFGSLEHNTDIVDEEHWAKEIDRRMNEIEAGTAVLIPWSQVRQELLDLKKARYQRD